MKFDDLKKINDSLLDAVFTPIDEEKYGVRRAVIVEQLISIRDNLFTLYEVDSKGDNATWRDLKAARRADAEIVDASSLLTAGTRNDLARKFSSILLEAVDASTKIMGDITKRHTRATPLSSLEVVIADKIIVDLKTIIENEKNEYDTLKKSGSTKEDIEKLESYAKEARVLYSEGATMVTAPQHKEELRQTQSYMGDLLDNLTRTVEEHKFSLEQNNSKQKDL